MKNGLRDGVLAALLAVCAQSVPVEQQLSGSSPFSDFEAAYAPTVRHLAQGSYRGAVSFAQTSISFLHVPYAAPPVVPVL